MSYLLRHSDIRVQAEGAWLDALLSHAPDVRGLILWASPDPLPLRGSMEDQAAQVFHEAGFATLLLNLLTPQEAEREPDLRFNIPQLMARLQAVLDWAWHQPGLEGIPAGLMATDTVAAAAIRLLAREPDTAFALVSHCGRADLAGGEPLRQLRCPLLMLETADAPASARAAWACLGGERLWQDIAASRETSVGATATDAATRAACDWFVRHLPVAEVAP
jgi:putative phosphoribosyl transferase